MKDETADQRSVFGWALPGSVVLHGAVIALLIFGLPVSLSQPQEEQAIKVDIVPPPPPKAEQSPPSPKAEQLPPSKPEQEVKVEAPPQEEKNDAAPRQSSSVGMPAFQFGEKDAGPREALDGDSAEDGSAASTMQQDRAETETAEAPAAAAEKALNGIPQPVAPDVPTPRPADAPKVEKPPKLQQARRLYSQSALGGPVVTSAISGVPRAVRVSRLCTTELREQLLRASPPYLPDMLPSESKNDGTTVNVSKAAFHADGQWYDLSYRCAVDAGATKVVSFAFRVGDPIPRSEWQRRGLPAG